jgi:hypothetical protein
LNITGELVEEGNFVLSRDGSHLAYLAADSQGRILLWVRKLDSPKGLPLDGTEGARVSLLVSGRPQHWFFRSWQT